MYIYQFYCKLVPKHLFSLYFEIPDLQVLQFSISRNSSNYITEVKQQCQQYQAQSQLLQLNTNQYDDLFVQNINFLTKISKYYPQMKELQDVHNDILNILFKNSQTLNQSFRQTIIISVTTLINQKLIQIHPNQLPQFLNLILIKDKDFRHRCQKLVKTLITNNQQLFKLTIQEIRKTRNQQLQTRLLPVLTQSYYDQVWKEERCYQDVVNLIADLLIQTSDLRVAEICANFLLQSEDQVDQQSDSEVSIEEYQVDDQARQEKLNKLYAELRDTVQAFKTNETARRKKILKLQGEIRKIKFKNDQKEQNKANQSKIIDYIYNINTFTDKLINKYIKNSCQFSFRLKIMEIIAECADVYKIPTPSFYTQLQKYLQPKQTDVQQIMYALVKAVNEHQNEQEIFQCVQTVIFNFMSSQNSDDEMIVGINFITNICKRNHQMLGESEQGIEILNMIFGMTTTKGVLDMHDTEKGTKTSILTRNSVVQAARELLNFYRDVNPLIIKKKYQNKESALKVKQLKQQQGISISEESEVQEEQQESSDESISSCDSYDEKLSRYKIAHQKEVIRHWKNVLNGARRSGRKLRSNEIDSIRNILGIIVDQNAQIVENAYIDSSDDAVYIPEIYNIPIQSQLINITEQHKQYFEEQLNEQNQVEFEEIEELSEYEDPTLHILTQDEIQERQMYRDEEREKFAPIDLNSFQKKRKMTAEERRQHTQDSKIPSDHKNHKWDRKQEKMQTKKLSRTNKEKQADKPLLMVLRSEAIRKKQARARWQKIAAAKKGGKK